ncbi:unnamed protein product [Vicia faba]|uniref:PHD-type domain-containing protein n=1 Tax=Vicia faba TaxID=3906 RepID=A0AAV0YR33_VICFA|nr:unnamed protein product [Vicia faba]
MDQERLRNFIIWAITTALASDSAQRLRSNESRIFVNKKKELGKESRDDSLVSKFLRWLTASVINGKLHQKSNDIYSRFTETHKLESLHSLLVHVENTSEQRQIQMITALLIQLIHCSANLPDSLRQASISNSVLEIPVDASYQAKCRDAVTEACSYFWTRVLQQLASVKTQDASELKSTMENLVTDLLTTLNLPEYPASASILEVLCAILIQNAGTSSKDFASRSMAIDILGTIAARLKHDAVICSQEKFWVLQDLLSKDAAPQNYQKDTCCACLGGRAENLFPCSGCSRLFHAECLDIEEDEVLNQNWYCHMCICSKQLAAEGIVCRTEA